MRFHLLPLLFIIFISHFSFLISNSSIAYAIEVGGHLTEDTTWSPDNNPYEVIETIYVDPEVTLTILPGTEIKVSGALCTDFMEYSQNFGLINGVSVAKMFRVDGKIIAEGTEQDSIIFTRLQDDPDYYWGTIYITSQADLSYFEHCQFEYTAGITLNVGNVAYGAISIYNGSGIIRNCSIVNCTSSIITRINNINEIEISGNTISHGDDLNNYTYQMRTFEFSTGNFVNNNKNALISDNIFLDCFLSFNSCYFIENNLNSSTIHLSPGYTGDFSSYIFDNRIEDFYDGITGGSSNIDESYYIKNNQFIDGYDGIDIDYAYLEISDNYFEGCDLYTDFTTSGLIYNNMINNGSAYGPGIVHFFNNISYNNENGIGICATSQRLSCTNNISINNNYAFEASASFNNCIFFDNEELEQFGVTGNPIFRNCIIDFPLDYPLIDGGGNIWVDELQAQELFEDIVNGDFHLIEGSLAIDAGFDTLGYYYPFDMEYNHRVWDGDGNGSAIIDIGPYEYGSPAFGGIEGYTYNPTTGEPVDYVLLKINNQQGEFTFADSVGNFEYKLPAGTYDIYTERVFYEDVIEYQVEVIDDEFTQLSIPMFETVDIEENTIIFSISDSKLTNYPNPFNPSTTISFSIQNDNNVELSIYNIKGQKVKKLMDERLPSGQHSIEWNGKDTNNKSVSSGIYFYKLKVNNKTKSVKKCLMLR